MSRHRTGAAARVPARTFAAWCPVLPDGGVPVSLGCAAVYMDRATCKVEASSDEAGRGVHDWGGVWHITYEAAGHTDTEVLPGSAGDTPEAAAQALDGIVRSFAASFAALGGAA